MNARMILTAAVAIALAAPLSAAAPRPSVKAMEADWLRLNGKCQSGPNHEGACAARERVYRALAERGICWVYSDWRVTPPNYRWHRCSQSRPSGYSDRAFDRDTDVAARAVARVTRP